MQRRFFSTREVCRTLKLNRATLNRYFQSADCPKPGLTIFGASRLRLWSASDIRRLREYCRRRYGRVDWNGGVFRGGRSKLK
jgi:AcrR family transcriptional regulator